MGIQGRFANHFRVRRKDSSRVLLPTKYRFCHCFLLLVDPPQKSRLGWFWPYGFWRLVFTSGEFAKTGNSLVG